MSQPVLTSGTESRTPKQLCFGYDLSVVVVAYNCRGWLQTCLTSLFQEQRHLRMEVLVVDNASQDGTDAMVRQEFSQVRLIKNLHNRGFAAATNQALRQSCGDFVLLLNPDTVVLPHALVRTVAFMREHPGVGVLGCRLLNQDGSLQRSCRALPSLWNYFTESSGLYKLWPRHPWFARFYMSHFDHDQIREVESVTGAFFLIRQKALQQVGLLDERFFLYTEETDWCYRARQQGWRVVFFHHAQVVHAGGASTGDQEGTLFVQLHHSQNAYAAKHFGNIQATLIRVVLFLGVVLRTIFWASAVLIFRRRQAFRHHARRYWGVLSWYLGATELRMENESPSHPLREKG